MNVYLAPILGITGYIYRNLYDKMFPGVDRYFAPFVSTVKAKVINPALLKDIIKTKDTTGRLIPQILGNEEIPFVNMANAIYDLGYEELNWNLGCPFPTVANKHKGSGLLQFPERIDKILDYAVPKLNGKLSVKMRLGHRDKNEIEKIIPILNKYPLTEVIIHPRIGKQGYTGSVYVDSFLKNRAELKHKTVYNGDIFNPEDYISTREIIGDIEDYMLGRGILSNPFLPQMVKGIKKEITIDDLMLIKDFHDGLVNGHLEAGYSKNYLCDKMKGIWVYLGVHLKKSKKFVKAINKSTDFDGYMNIVNEYFRNEPGWNIEPEEYFFVKGR